jgi:sulfatase modifying factor 1
MNGLAPSASAQRGVSFALALSFALAACRPEAPAAPGAPAAAGPAAREAAVSAPAAPAGLPTPGGMVYVPGGPVRIGADDGDAAALPTERPAFDAEVAAFFLDRSPVTVARFRGFVEATAHVTEAERLGDAAVLDPHAGWQLVPGASWHRPLGPEAAPAPEDHPVTQVSWGDAVAFCAWADGRLPTEVEWEHAARGGTNRRHRYAWDGELHHGGHPHANTLNTDDGFSLTSPVGAFGATALGLTDMGGNVWEWTDAWFRPYAERDRPFTPTPTSERVLRGGSFLCHADYCHGYRVSARSHATPGSALFNAGFRCARDAGGT